jgi:ABC-type multidrug transport system ATPase subunit
LDAAVTFDICHSLRKQAVADNKSVVIALLQPTPEVYALFDSIILMREGQIVRSTPVLRSTCIAHRSHRE